MLGYRGPGLGQIIWWYLLGMIAMALAFAFLVGLIKALWPWIGLTLTAWVGVRWWLHRTQPW